MAKKSNKQKKIIRYKKSQKKKVKQKLKTKFSPQAHSFPNIGSLFNTKRESIKDIFETKLKEYSKLDTASVFSSLLLDPEYQSSQYRIEKAIYISLSFCQGDQIPDICLVKFILERCNELYGFMEDPAEDVFISTVWFEDEQYKLSTGLWEGGVYQTQLFLNFMNEAPNDEKHIPIKKSLKAILTASDLTIEKNKLQINEMGSPYPVEKINYDELPNLDYLIDRVELNNFDESEFLPSIDIATLDMIYKQEFGASDLEEAPFIVCRDTCRIILPSSILVCIKRQVISFMRTNYSDEFLNSLFLKSQAKKILETNLFRAFKGIPIKFHKLEGINDFGYSETLLEFDTGHFFHFLFLGETFNSLDDDWFNGFSNQSQDLSSFINRSIEKTKKYVLDKLGKQKGCTIIVSCGYGRGLMLGLNFKTDSTWMLEIINSHDLDTLSNDFDCTPHKIWRIIESLQQLKSMGTHIDNFNGFLNLYAYAKEQDYSLIPHESFQEPKTDPASVRIVLPLNCQVGLRSKTLINNEEKKVIHHHYEQLKVVRGFANSYFAKNDKFNIFVPKEINKNIFQSVYICGDHELWIEQSVHSDIDLDFQIQLYEAALSWIKKIIVVVESEGLVFPKSLKAWNIEYEFPEDFEKVSERPEPKEILSCYSNEFFEPVLLSKFGTEFIDGLRLEKNYSERTLITALVSYVCEIQKSPKSEAILEQIIESYDAKHTHLFVASEYQEFFISEKQEPIYIERADEHNIKLNLGWINRDRSLGNLIEGKENCKKYLNELVGNAWSIIKDKLNLFNRETIIRELLKNIEISEHQRKRWERSYRSNLVLQHDKEDLQNVVYNKLALLNAASLSSRLVIEMAICECPQDDGIEASTLDIQELICLASLMHHMGGVSEAINYEAIEPKLVISTFGDVLFDHEFEDTIVNSYARDINDSSLAKSVKEYSKHLIEATPVEKANDLLENNFNEAWFEEFGFTLDEVRKFIDIVEDYGLKINELVFNISCNELIALFNKEESRLTKIIIKELTIYPRESWTTIPPPFKPNDWQPWKFRRRYSLVMRPIVQVDKSNLLISPQHLRRAFFYLIRSCHRAKLDENNFSSPLMRKWIGSTRGKNGLAFNTTVAKRLIELGWTVREEIKLTEILNQKLEDFGDVDVLAWNNENNIVAIIECKALDFAKTQGEIARQLFDFKGQENQKGRKDRLLKHVHRLNVLNKNKDGLSNFINTESEINMKGLVVFSNTVPMEFNEKRLYRDNIEFLTYEQLEKIADL